MEFDILFEDITAATMDGELEVEPDTGVLRHAYVGVAEGRIAWLSTEKPVGTARRRIPGQNRVLIPGLINAHTHIAMTALRGYADDRSLHDWLFGHILPAEARLDARGVFLGARLGMLEALASGTTAICDSYFRIGAIADAALDCGLRARLTNMATWAGQGAPPPEDRARTEVEELRLRFAGHERVGVTAGIHAVYTSNPETWAWAAEYAAAHGLRLQVHLSETRRENEECRARWGLTPAQALFEAGVFAVPVTAAHCVHLEDEDLVILREHGAAAVHNPASNLKLASGLPDMPRLLDAGLPVALGTDGVASNNSHDLFRDMKLAALLAKGVTGDASALPAYRALEMATVHGAAAMGRADRAGRLREGFDADLVMVDFDSPRLQPCYSVLSNLVYAASGRDVALTMVAGQILYENGEFPHADWRQAAAQLNEYAAEKFHTMRHTQ